jgi:hypothetical protein
MVGHIKLDRKILNWEWYQDINVCRVFIHLLLIANHKDGRWKGYEIKRGQLITGRLKLGTSLRLSEKQIRVCLDKLKETNEITIKTTNKFSTITICKYDTYQSFKNENGQQIDQQQGQQVANEGPTKGQQRATNNNDNNNKEGNKEEGVISIFENPKLWEQERGYFFNDGKWIFDFCTKKNVSVELFDERAKEFISDIELKSEFKSVKELQRHFTNWYNLKSVNGKSYKKERELSDYEKGIQAQREAAKNKYK